VAAISIKAELSLPVPGVGAAGKDPQCIQQCYNIIQRLQATPPLVTLPSFRSTSQFDVTLRAISVATRSLLE
jgi:hypothetical protein